MQTHITKNRCFNHHYQRIGRRFPLKAIAIAVLCCSHLNATAQTTQKETAQERQAREKYAEAGFNWLGSTFSGFYGIYEADKRFKIPGDSYQSLAREVGYKIETTKAASTLAKAPFDLAADALYVFAATNPETAMVPALFGYGTRKFGEAVGQTIMEQGQKQGLEILAGGLNRNKYSEPQILKMNEDELRQTISDMKYGTKTLKEILYDQPEALRLIQDHAIAQDRELLAAALLGGKQTKKDVQEIRNILVKNSKDLNDFKVATNAKIEELKNGLQEVTDSLEKTQKSIDELKERTTTNEKSIHALTLIASQTWTPQQKLDAIKNGLFPELAGKEAATIKVLEQQIETERIIAKFNEASQDLGNIATIASRLGVNGKVVDAIRSGQIITQSIALFEGQHYLSAAANILGLGGMGQADPAASYHKETMAKLNEISEKLNVVIELQKATLEGINAIIRQLNAINGQLDTIEHIVLDNNTLLQQLISESWHSCDAFINTLNTFTPSSRQEFFRVIGTGNIDGQNHLLECYQVYAKEFDGPIKGMAIAETKFSAISMGAEILGPREEKTAARLRNDRNLDTYSATRNFVLAYAFEKKLNTAKLVAKYFDVQGGAIGSELRDRTFDAQENQTLFEELRCDPQNQKLNAALLTFVCSFPDPQSKRPREEVVSEILNKTLLGPQVYRAIDVGLPLAELSNFLYQNNDIDILPALSLRQPLTRKGRGFLRCCAMICESLRRVPASLSGLTAPTLHRLTSAVRALKH